MTDNELLLAISNLFDAKLSSNLAPIENRLRNIELKLENNIEPRLQNIEACYLSTFERYKNTTEEHESMKEDITVLKRVVAEHSEKLQLMA